MARYSRELGPSGHALHSGSNIDSKLKELYRNAEEKASCACLVRRDMNEMVTNIIRQENPSLNQTEVEMHASMLMKTSYEDYKNEDSTLYCIRKSFRKIVRKQPSCSCKKNNINLITKLVNKNSEYNALEESVDEQECNCHITCIAQYERDNLLQPLQRFVSINRSFKLKMKHLNSEKYGYLNTGTPIKKSKPEVNASMKCEESSASPAVNKSFQVKMESVGSPTSKDPRYKFHFTAKSEKEDDYDVSNSSKDQQIFSKMVKSEREYENDSKNSFENQRILGNETNVCFGNSNNKIEVANNQSHVSTNETKSEKTTETNTYFGNSNNKLEVANNQSHVSINEMKSEKTTEKRVVVEFTHCNSHCYICSLERCSKSMPQLLYCGDHCPQCTTNLKKKINTEALNQQGTNSNVCQKTPKERSKSESRVHKDMRTSSLFKNTSSSPDENLVKQVNPKKVLNEKANVENSIVEEGIRLLENNVNLFNISLDEHLEWDSMGLGLSPKKNESKKKHDWSNTVSVLENIKNNHIQPLKHELKGLQKCFKKLKQKHKY